MAKSLADGALHLVELGSLCYESFVSVYGKAVRLQHGRRMQLSPVLVECAPPHIILISAHVVGSVLLEHGCPKVGVPSHPRLDIAQALPPEQRAETIRGLLAFFHGYSFQLGLAQVAVPGVFPDGGSLIGLLLLEQLLHEVKLQYFTREALESLVELFILRGAYP